jgi:hypothetical protein
MKRSMLNFDFSNKNALPLILTILLISTIVTYAFVSSLQVLLFLLWGIEQTKLQIFVVVAVLKLITM